VVFHEAKKTGTSYFLRKLQGHFPGKEIGAKAAAHTTGRNDKGRLQGMIQQTRDPNKYGAWKGECVDDDLEKDKGGRKPPPVCMELADSNHATPVEQTHSIQDDGRED